MTITIGQGQTRVIVPNVQGMDSEQARAAIQNANLKYQEKAVYSDFPKGRVQSQKPDPNTSVTPQTLVTVAISQGPEMRVVPDQSKITGKSLAEATSVLTAAGFQVVSQYTASALPKDQVISMAPPNYGQQMQKGSVLTLTASDNSLMILPDLSKLTPDQALAALKQAGWSADPNALVQTAKEDPNQALWGTITAQNPAVNAKVSKNSVVNVTVASEPHVPMPDLTGKTVNEAYDALSALGWHGQLRVTKHNELVPPTGQANLIFPAEPGAVEPDPGDRHRPGRCLSEPAATTTHHLVDSAEFAGRAHHQRYPRRPGWQRRRQRRWQRWWQRRRHRHRRWLIGSRLLGRLSPNPQPEPAP